VRQRKKYGEERQKEALMFDANKRLDDAIRAIKALPHTYQERALLSLRTLLADWEKRKTAPRCAASSGEAEMGRVERGI